METYETYETYESCEYDYINDKIFVKSLINYKDNMKNGRCVYYKDGTITCYSEYVDDVLNGNYCECYNNGNYKKKCVYVNGKLTGQYYEYNEDGKIIFKCNYNNGMIDGNYVEYDEDENIICIKTYENNNELMKYVYTHDDIYVEEKIYKNNVINCINSYKDGMKHGYCHIFNEKGELKIISSYENNKLNGQFIQYYDDGYNYICEYKDDLLNGNFKFYKGNKLLTSVLYKDNLKVSTNTYTYTSDILKYSFFIVMYYVIIIYILVNMYHLYNT